VLDQSQFAHALKDTVKMVMNANNAHQDMFNTQPTTSNAFHKHVTIETQSSVTLETAIDANNANKDTDQMPLKLDVTESSQLAHALKSMTQLDITASNAHSTKLLPITTPDVSLLPAPTHFKFSETHRTAINAETVIEDLPQITSEELA